MIGQLNTIIVFVIITLGLGFSVLYLARATRQKNPILYVLEMAAVGIATFSFLAVVFDLLRVPLHVLIYLALAVICPIIAVVQALRTKKAPELEWRTEATVCAVLLLLIMGGLFAVYHKGAFSYPYLEDDDPWLHAMGSTYVARELTYSIDPEAREVSPDFTYYLEPYPPTYDAFMGVLRQMNDSISWTLKFFNVLLISLAVAFTYLLAKAYLKTDVKALFAAFVIAVLPSFMSHFIWSQTLAIVIFLAALYAVVQALTDDSWRIPAIILVASELVTQPVVSFFFGIAVLLLVGCVFLHEWLQKGRKPRERFAGSINGLIVGAGGVALSMIYWGAQLFKWGLGGMLAFKGGEITPGSGFLSSYGLQKYTLGEVIFAPSASRIDQAVGWGVVLSIALFASIIIVLVLAKKTLDPRRSWVHLHLLAWFAVLAYVLFAPTLGLPAFASARAWAYIAIPLALLVTSGVFMLVNSLFKENLWRLVAIGVIAVGIAATSVPAKVAVQTAMWPPGVQWTMIQTDQGPRVPDLEGYVAMQQTIPKNSRVFAFCGSDSRIIGFDMQADPWDLEHARMRKESVNKSTEEVFAFLDSRGYEYVTFDASCVSAWGADQVTNFTQRLAESGRLQAVMSQPGFLLARVS